jgi:hypothetical protein
VGAASEHFAAEDGAADRLIDAAHLFHAFGSQADLVASVGIFTDGGRYVRGKASVRPLIPSNLWNFTPLRCSATSCSAIVLSASLKSLTVLVNAVADH